MSGRRDSNPRPLAWKANALSTELLPLIISCKNAEQNYKISQNSKQNKLPFIKVINSSNHEQYPPVKSNQ